MGKGVMFQYFEWNCKNDGSLWRELAARAREIKNLGTTAVWMPPAFKAMDGINDAGYAPYDLYDLGEFDQEGTVRTKYGTRDEYLAAIKAVQADGMDAYADVVLNHRMGADETEDVEIEEVDPHDRNHILGGPYKINAWSKFTFPGRFVDNHDSQPGQALQSWVDDWFKPLAYGLILLRDHGYPCLFYGDYFGNPGDDKGRNKLTSHRKIIDDFLQARQKHAHGKLHDYFDNPQCIGWTWSGDAEHPASLAVVLSTGDAGKKTMKMPRTGQTFRDLTGQWPEPVTTDDQGVAEFRCPPGSISAWCAC